MTKKEIWEKNKFEPVGNPKCDVCGKNDKELSIVINTLESCLNDHLADFVFSADEFVVKE